MDTRRQWYKQQQYRSYIFLPTSFQELLQNFRSVYDTTKKRRTVLVKLVQDQYTKTKDRVSKGKVHRLSLRTRRRLRRGNNNAILLKKQVKERLLFHSSNLKQATDLRVVGAQNRITRLKTKGIESLLRYQRKTRQYLPTAYKTKAITLEEYSKADWFDENGYPRTARDEITGRFVNPWRSVSTNGHHSIGTFLTWRLNRFITKTKNYFWNDTTTTTTPLVERGDIAAIFAPPLVQSHPDAIKLTWIGHATCLVELAHGDITVLTDPHFSSYAFPFDFGGPKRLVDLPDMSSLPPVIDVCCISHDHYDHLDYKTICALKDRISWWVVPLGLKEWLQVECNVNPDQIVEMRWWESITFQKVNSFLSPMKQEVQKEEDGVLKVTCAPAQHWCSRTPWDRNLRLWCSWAMEYHQEDFRQRFYFAGDSGYPTEFPLFRQIGDLLGPFDLAAIPIGAYAPRWFMADSHVCPREAVQIHKDLQSKKSVAIHWGTFDLADEAEEEPPILLQQALREEQGEIDFVVLKHGSSVESTPDEYLDTIESSDDDLKQEEERSSEDDNGQQSAGLA